MENSEKKHLDVVAGLIIRDGHALFCQRHEHDSFGGLWELPGGCIEAGESHAEALTRELKEELGIENAVVGRLVETFSDENEELHIDVYLYQIYRFEGEPQCLECRDMRFATFAEALLLDLAPCDRKMVTFLHEAFS